MNLRLYCCCFWLCFSFIPAFSQSDEQHTTSVEEMSKKRQDPVSGLRSVFLQEVLLPVGDGTASSFSVQPVYPFKLGTNLKLITYTIIPFQSIPPITEGATCEAGMGNVLFNGYFSSITKKGKFSWGIGPAMQIPTRTNSALGSSALSLGPTALLYYAGDKFSLGTVLQNYWSLGGNGDNKVNSGSLQYIAYYNFSQGWFVESNATIVANWLADSNNRWLVPIGGGPGKTFKIGEKSKLFYSAAAQAFYNIEKPEYVGNWQAIFQFQVIF
ncbi:hypothetical protein [Flavobacterium phragmitis]|uniref:Neuromedin U n=1 Tax=Flavobacterium phragmitis TaxID=739143 RepID=A0A1I1SR09_9FLAO|nr:hypothetical protein [Flavobacterium phragmitis]SFD48905.1 hypothetical protein SAMN05216297_108173 [Flavobacterium phragmitis]